MPTMPAAWKRCARCSWNWPGRECLRERQLRLELIEAFPPVHGGRDQPARREHPDDHVADHAEVIVEAADRVPEPSAELQLVGKQPQSLYASDQQRDDH